MALNPITHFSGGEKARLALAQFEGMRALVSHDRHLLRATTDQFLIVADGKLQPCDGDMDDYRDWLFKTRLAAQQQAALDSTAAVQARQGVRLKHPWPDC